VLVDVGIPTFRRPEYLSEAVESVLRQSFEHWQLHVSEDGPGDDAVAQVLERFRDDARVRITAARANLGPAGNKNRLLEHGAAPYVAILDDDDRWDPGFLARRVEFLERHPECGFVFSGCREINSAGEPIGRYLPFDSEGVKSSAEVLARLLEENVVRTPTLVARRGAYEAVGARFDESFPYVYDWEMWLRLAMRFPVGYVADLDVDYRYHEQQDTYGARVGSQFLRLAEHADAMLRKESLAMDGNRSALRAVRSGWSISAMLDELEQGNRRSALGYLVRALRLRPRSVYDPRALAGICGLVLGRRLGGALIRRLHERARRARWQALESLSQPQTGSARAEEALR
jgi:glycosyltransferase involved in cell wall biosynthesis